MQLPQHSLSSALSAPPWCCRVDFLGDIHGDEEIEYNFLAGNEGIPAWDERLRKLQDEFCNAFLHTSPDFQLGNGYGWSSLDSLGVRLLLEDTARVRLQGHAGAPAAGVLSAP